MERLSLTIVTLLIGLAFAQEPTTYSFDTEAGNLAVTPLGHASVRLELGDTVIHVDPYSEVTDYSQQPDADWVWITHEHGDHFDPVALEEIVTSETRLVMDSRSAEQYGAEAGGTGGAETGGDGATNVTVMANGDSLELENFTLRAVPAYNVVRERDNGQKYHPEGWYNGYVLETGDFRLHLAGDTECVPEFGELDNLTVSFLPINLPFTMPPEEAATCYKVLNPQIAIPYHQGESNPQVVADLLMNSGVEVRVLELP